MPIRDIALEPGYLLGSIGQDSGADGGTCGLHDGGGEGEDEDFGDGVREEGMDAAVADSLTATGYNGDFSREVGNVMFEGELLAGRGEGVAMFFVINIRW